MTAEELRKKYCNRTGTDETIPHEAWAFGAAADELADLVLRGIKTATASGYELYFVEGEEEEVPKEGDYSVILNSKEEACCVIKTTRTYILPFDEVGEEQAWKEGEGDRSLSYWRQVHWDFFTEDYASCGLSFHEKRQILCEEFEVLERVE